MDRHQQIKTNIQAIKQGLPADVRLIAVTKHVAPEYIRTAAAAGLTDIGENRVQEALEKHAQLRDLSLTWHLIGHLQSNKAGKALQIFDWIHSVDSLALAQRLNQLAAEQNKRPHVLLQVKLVPEDTAKSGFLPSALWEALPVLAQLQHLSIEGLMTMAPYSADAAVVRKVFHTLKCLKDKIMQQNIPNMHLSQLSMGMSQDYPLALIEGATMIRVGSKIFAHCA